mmetsp:Transcript_33102/g.112381  ORF Transcript_33102/g.112381 Transcript_33102/m.112381 type:complete len:387 (-) Transcript_33102:25-1185(-)
MSRVFSSPALTARIMEYVRLKESLPLSAVCHTFFESIPLISCARIDRKVLRNPHLFVRLEGLRRLTVRCRHDSADCARFFAIACSSVRKWRDVQIYPAESDLVNDQLVPILLSLARAVRAGLLPELQDFSFYGIDRQIAKSPQPERQELQNAALRVLSALPNNAAVRIGITWGLPVCALRPLVGATFDPNLESEYMDPVALCFAFSRSDVPSQSFVRELVQRGMKLDALGALTRMSPLGICMDERNFDMARVYLELGADPNLGHPSPLQMLCERDGYPTGEDAQMLKLLLKAGADPFASFNGDTAMDCLTFGIAEMDDKLFDLHKDRFDAAMEDRFQFEDNLQFETELCDKPKIAKAALLEMQSLLVRAMHDSNQRLRRTKARAEY